MAFDLFSMPQGPAIPVNLFAESTTAGINAGNASPSPISAAIRGAQEGVKQGQAFVENQQQAEIRQNQIDQLPITNQIQEAQLQHAQLTNQIDQLKTEAALANKDSILEAEKIKAENDVVEQRRRRDDLRTQNSIISDSQSGDPSVRKGILTNPLYRGVLSSDSKFAQRILGDIWGSLSSQEKDAAIAQLNVVKERELEIEREKVNAATKASIIKEQSKINDNFVNTFADAISGIEPAEYSKRLEMYPKGMKQLDANGKINSDVPDVTTQNEADKNVFTLYRDKKPLRDVSETDYKLFNSFKNSQGTLDNIIRENIFGPTVASPKPTNQPQPVPTGPGVPSFGAQQAPVPSTISIGNQTIVDQKRSQFETLAKNPPPGIQIGTLEERLKAKKDLIRQGVTDLYKNRAKEQAIPEDQISNAAPSTLPIAPMVPQELPPPLVERQPISLNIEPSKPIKSTVVDTVNSDPLTASESALVKGLAAVESRGVRDAKSPTGVVGLLQVTRATASQYGLNRDIPEENVLAGKLYLYDNLLRFNGNLRLALAAYNGGHGLISEAIRNTQSVDWGTIKGYLKENLSAKKYKEVSSYPDKVLKASTQFIGSKPDADDLYVSLLDRNNLIGTAEA